MELEDTNIVCTPDGVYHMTKRELDIYVQGRIDAMKEHDEKLPPVITYETLQERFNEGESAARNHINDIRRAFNGSKLNLAGRVLRSELLAWENSPERKWKERL